MSELEADNTFVFGEECLAYKKSEADKVIAEKDKEIVMLDDLAHAHNIELLRKENLIEEKEKEIRYQKYKRCLAIAGKCRLRARWFGDNAFYKKELWALQWCRRWIKIAEKCKENQ